MKKFILGLVLLSTAAGSFTSCKRDENIPAPEADTVPLAFPQVSTDPARQFYNLATARASVASNPTRPVFEFTLTPSGSGNSQLASILVYKSFRRGGAFGPRVLAGEYTDFPATVSINSQEALTGIARAGGNPVIAASTTQTNQLLSQDAIVFTFDYKVADGTVFTTTPVDATGTISPAATTLANPPYSIIAVFRTP